MRFSLLSLAATVLAAVLAGAFAACATTGGPPAGCAEASLCPQSYAPATCKAAPGDEGDALAASGTNACDARRKLHEILCAQGVAPAERRITCAEIAKASSAEPASPSAPPSLRPIPSARRLTEGCGGEPACAGRYDPTTCESRHAENGQVGPSAAGGNECAAQHEVVQLICRQGAKPADFEVWCRRDR